jgi:hypothetical protein
MLYRLVVSKVESQVPDLLQICSEWHQEPPPLVEMLTLTDLVLSEK